MSDLFNTMAVSASGLKAQSTRLRHISENISNADTPGFRRKMVSFESELDRGRDMELVTTGHVQLDQRPLEQVYDPAHPMADETGHYDGSNVNLVVEIADARQAQRSYEANLKMFDQARKMTSSLFELLRK
ncbi:flagellar basal body rod protein FlgC [Aliiruegeria sabulilitoris]|uniref:flagellar basal body rod protein FlgC n=1 Tax=Aliiruegeria sabulilitoris TaxID=1510458 RepID=UPI00082A70BD|nr:flagellar basal body rod protein FlgC [Aliiruegeria sabulilitoris]NDR58535.1 flagellar basal body rod protein FlgC [Pseudoruegeria sp. M32A2M]